MVPNFYNMVYNGTKHVETIYNTFYVNIGTISSLKSAKNAKNAY